MESRVLRNSTRRLWLVFTIRLERSNKSVTPFRNRFDEMWLFCRVPQRLPQSRNCAVQPVIEINKRIGRPKLLSQFLPRDDISRSLQQQRQNAEWLFL